MAIKKENIEIRFFFSPASAKKFLKKMKNEGREFEPYSFTDYYFRKGKLVAKIRDWHSKHRPMLELILVRREKGVKKEAMNAIPSIQRAFSQLEGQGYKKDLGVGKIYKKKAWLITKSSKPTYAIEFIPHLGWSGEIEVPEKDKKKVGVYLHELKSYGANGFSKKSLLELFRERNKKVL